MAIPSSYLARMLALFQLLEHGFGALVIFAYWQLLIGSTVPASTALGVALAVHLLLSGTRIAFLLYLLRPVRRWLSLTTAERGAPEALLAASQSAFDLPYRYAFWHAVTWGIGYLLVTLALTLTSSAAGAMAATLWPATIFFGVGLGLGAYALNFPLWGFLLAPLAGELSLDRRRAGVTAKTTGRSLRRRSLTLGLALAFAPLAWVSSAVYVLAAPDSARVVQDAAGVTDYLVIFAAFSVVVLAWAPLCAGLLAGTIATPVVRVTQRLDQLRRAPDAHEGYVPISFQDELGVLASATNDLIDELGARAARITKHEQERDGLLRRLERERSLLQHLIQNLPVAVALLDRPVASIALENKAFASAAPGRLRRLQDWPELARVAGPVLAQVSTRGAAASIRGTRIRADLYVDLICVPFAGEQPQDLLLLVDVTQQIQSHEEVQEMALSAAQRASELRSVMDHLVEAVLVCDADGQVNLANESFLRMMGDREPSQLSWPIEAFIPMVQHPDGRPIPREQMPLVRALGGTVVRHQEVIWRRTPTDIPRHLMISAAPIRGEGTATPIVGAVAVAHDVTDERELEFVKRQFVRTAAHELKTPVAVMKAHAQHLLKAQTLPERLRNGLAAIDRGADRIDRIVRNLIDVMQIQFGRLALAHEQVKLRAVLEEVAERACARWPGGRVHLEVPPDATVTADPRRLAQVLEVLLDNAFEHSAEGQEVLIGCGGDEHTIQLSVSDHGSGIPAGKQPFIFRPFYRANQGYEETGLGVGLYIAREIMVRHGGTLTFSSEEERGTTFTLRLPVGGHAS